MIGIAFLFIVLGILVKHGKMYFLLAGYNTMSVEEKENYDIVGLATFFRNVMFVMAIIILMGTGLSYWLQKPTYETYFMIGSLVIGVPYLLIQSNSKKYKVKRK